MEKLKLCSKEKCRRMWVSFGVFMTIIQFLDQYLIIELQVLNKFCYNVALSRVLPNIRKAAFYLAYPSDTSKIISIKQTMTYAIKRID